jgi:hypothetical protein
MPIGNGGIIGVANNPTSSVATGIWSLQEQFKAEKAGDWPSPVVFIDVNFLVIAGGGSGGRTTQNYWLAVAGRAVIVVRYLESLLEGEHPQSRRFRLRLQQITQ